MTTPPERIEEIVQIFQHEYGQYTSLEALSIASDWLRNTLHQKLQKARAEERAFILQELALRDIPDEHGCYPFYTARQISSYLKGEWRIKPDQSELDQDNK